MAMVTDQTTSVRADEVECNPFTERLGKCVGPCSDTVDYGASHMGNWKLVDHIRRSSHAFTAAASF